MTLYQDAVGLMEQIQDETKDMRSGVMPSVYVLLALQGEVVSLYHRLGEEQGKTFNRKELTNLVRKVAAAEHHLKGRREFSLTQEDAKMEAVQKTESEYRKEIEAMTLYENSKLLRDSLGRAFDHLQQVISTLKWSEGRASSPQQP